MKATRYVFLAVGLACAAAAAPAVAEGWSLSNLNPFKKEEREVSAYTPPPGYSSALSEEPPKSGFRFPSFKLPSLSSQPKPPGQPSTMQRMGQGTKNFFSKTADALTPWDNKEEESRHVRTTGVRRTYNGSPSAAPPEKKGLFSWFKKDEPDEPRTVNGFIAQPRPRF